MPFLSFLVPLDLGRQAFVSDTLTREIRVGTTASAVRGGAAFLEREMLAQCLQADSEYDAARGEVAFWNDRHRLRLRVGTRTMLVDGRKATIPAPFRRDGTALLPVRDVARALGRTVEYEKASDSLIFPRAANRRPIGVSLPSARPGVVILSASRGRGEGGTVRVHALSNAPEGEVVFQLRDAEGRTFSEIAAPGVGGYYGESVTYLTRKDADGWRDATAVVAFIRRKDGTTTAPVVATTFLKDR